MHTWHSKKPRFRDILRISTTCPEGYLCSKVVQRETRALELNDTLRLATPRLGAPAI